MLISSSLCSIFWTLSSSSNVVHSCVVLSKNCGTFSASFSIISNCGAACFSLSAITSRGVIGVKFSLSSSISFLYSLTVCAMIWIYSSALLTTTYMLSGILLKTSFSLCSNLYVCLFSSCVSRFTYFTTNYMASFPFLVTCNSFTSILSHVFTSYVTSTCSLYNASVGILSNTNCTYSRSLSGIWDKALSTYNIYVFIWKLGLSCTTV
jgi:hypothetical protein